MSLNEGPFVDIQLISAFPQTANPQPLLAPNALTIPSIRLPVYHGLHQRTRALIPVPHVSVFLAAQQCISAHTDLRQTQYLLFCRPAGTEKKIRQQGKSSTTGIWWAPWHDPGLPWASPAGEISVWSHITVASQHSLFEACQSLGMPPTGFRSIIYNGKKTRDLPHNDPHGAELRISSSAAALRQ